MKKALTAKAVFSVVVMAAAFAVTGCTPEYTPEREPFMSMISSPALATVRPCRAAPTQKCSNAVAPTAIMPQSSSMAPTTPFVIEGNPEDDQSVSFYQSYPVSRR